MFKTSPTENMNLLSSWTLRAPLNLVNMLSFPITNDSNLALSESGEDAFIPANGKTYIRQTSEISLFHSLLLEHVQWKNLFIPMILPRSQKQIFRYWEPFCLFSSLQVLSLEVAAHHDCYTWNYRGLVIFLVLRESLAEGGLETLTRWSMRKILPPSYPDNNIEIHRMILSSSVWWK